MTNNSEFETYLYVSENKISICVIRLNDRKRLHEKEDKYLECDPIKSFITVDQKTISFEVFIFKKDISVNQYKRNYGLAWTVNGHTHALQKDAVFKQDFGKDMATSMFVNLNCDGIEGKARENLFSPARDRIKPESKLAQKIKEKGHKEKGRGKKTSEGDGCWCKSKKIITKKST